MEPACDRTPDALDALASALADERSALLAADVRHLLRANAAKEDALAALESAPPPAHDARLAQVREANAVNGAVLAKRLGAVERTLRRLRTAGQNGTTPGYDARGRGQSWSNRRSLAVA